MDIFVAIYIDRIGKQTIYADISLLQMNIFLYSPHFIVLFSIFAWKPFTKHIVYTPIHTYMCTIMVNTISVKLFEMVVIAYLYCRRRLFGCMPMCTLCFLPDKLTNKCNNLRGDSHLFVVNMIENQWMKFKVFAHTHTHTQTQQTLIVWTAKKGYDRDQYPVWGILPLFCAFPHQLECTYA